METNLSRTIQVIDKFTAAWAKTGDPFVCFQFSSLLADELKANGLIISNVLDPIEYDQVKHLDKMRHEV